MLLFLSGTQKLCHRIPRMLTPAVGGENSRNCNCNLKTSKALLKSQAHQGTSLFTSAATNQRGFSKGGVKRSSGQISRIPGGDRVAVKVGVLHVEKLNDQMGQGRSV